MPRGTDTAAIVIGAMEANHPTVPRPKLNSPIIRGSNGPADAQMSPMQVRTRITEASITNQ